MTVRPNIAIISGGQTGADRAALDFAIAHGISHSGWCPRRRRAEDGAIPAQYLLRETPSSHYSQRTEWNVRDSDATVVFSIKPRLTGGTRLTFELARRLGKPVLHLSRDEADAAVAAEELRAFIEDGPVRALNVAGPRASQEPEIGAFVDAVLTAAFREANADSSLRSERHGPRPQ
jgi:hypothetical protein